MSKFSVFMKANKKVKENEKYAPTESMVDENGKRVEDGRKYEIFAGCSQPDERSIELTGTEPVKVIWEKED